jgi:hypothetical protein
VNKRKREGQEIFLEMFLNFFMKNLKEAGWRSQVPSYLKINGI